MSITFSGPVAARLIESALRQGGVDKLPSVDGASNGLSGSDLVAFLKESGKMSTNGDLTDEGARWIQGLKSKYFGILSSDLPQSITSVAKAAVVAKKATAASNDSPPVSSSKTPKKEIEVKS